MFINRWMDKDVVHIPHGILFNHDNLEGWDGDARGYTYGWFMLLYSRNQHNIVKQFSESESLVAQSCPTLCNPMDCSPPDSSANGILQARILEWVAIPFSRGSSWTRDQTWLYSIESRFFTVWATREANLPVPAGKVDQVPRTCTTQLRNTTAKEYYNKDGVERIRHVSTKGRSLTMTLFSILYLSRRAWEGQDS